MLGVGRDKTIMELEGCKNGHPYNLSQLPDLQQPSPDSLYHPAYVRGR